MSKYMEICPITTLTRFFPEESSLATRHHPDKRVRFNARAGDVLAFIRKVHGQDGRWEEIELAVDSGATESVVPNSMPETIATVEGAAGK